MKDHEGIHLLGKLYTASHFGRIHGFRCVKTPCTIITQRHYRNYFRIAHSPNSQKWKCFDSLGTSVPKFAILYSSIHSFRFISFSFREKFRSLSLYSTQFHSYYCPVGSFHFDSFQFTSLLGCICSFGLSLPCVSKSRLFLLIVWIFEALSIKQNVTCGLQADHLTAL